MTATAKIRVGAVNYLNTRPLVYGLDRHADSIQLVFDLPSRLADALAAGGYDVALIPSVEALLQPGYTIVSDACIACRGPVMSVKLFFRVPAADVRTLALDEGSRTSAALAKILLWEQYRVQPQLERLPIGAGLQDTQADAILLIGDRAMHTPPGRYSEVWDLGDQWVRWTGLPFVFALWTARPVEKLPMAGLALRQARDEGVAAIEKIAAREAAPLGLTVPQCVSYLRDNLHFHFGPREQQGLERFHQYAAALGLVPEPFELGTCQSA